MLTQSFQLGFRLHRSFTYSPSLCGGKFGDNKKQVVMNCVHSFLTTRFGSIDYDLFKRRRHAGIDHCADGVPTGEISLVEFSIRMDTLLFGQQAIVNVFWAFLPSIQQYIERRGVYEHHAQT